MIWLSLDRGGGRIKGAVENGRGVSAVESGKKVVKFFHKQGSKHRKQR